MVTLLAFAVKNYKIKIFYANSSSTICAMGQGI